MQIARALGALAVVVLSAAAGAAPPTRPARRPTLKSDRPCGEITAKGCCHEGYIWWCDKGRLVGLDCRGRERCGWHATGIYDCSSAGSVDPSGAVPRHCRFGDAGPPAGMQARSCGALTREGCCDNEVLRFCKDGSPRAIDCGRNPYCGWRGVGQIYNCGTRGESDPRGNHPQRCPSLPESARVVPVATSTGSSAPPTANSPKGPKGPTAAGATKEKEPATDRSSCEVGGDDGEPSRGFGFALVLLLLVVRLAAGSKQR